MASAILFLELGAIAIIFAGLPLTFVWTRRGYGFFEKLNWVLVFMTFDLIIFGAFTIAIFTSLIVRRSSGVKFDLSTIMSSSLIRWGYSQVFLVVRPRVLELNSVSTFAPCLYKFIRLRGGDVLVSLQLLQHLQLMALRVPMQVQQR